ncbi:MAG TPA: hypothetical protein VJP07_11280 [Dehalococcoidia bacterium]|nr:hypothetical protein [Dehalococcoidia bacterium]
MPQQGDRVQREIEDLLDKLDNFVPEERFISKVKSRRKQQEGPGLLSRLWASLTRPFRRITLGHVMLAGIALMLTSWLAPGLYGDYARLASILGLAITGIVIILSLMGWDARRTIAGGSVEKRWRGQVINYEQPAAPNRVRDWFRRRGRR